MSQSIECGKCHKKYRLDPKLAGKTVRCKICGDAMAIPAARPTDGGEYDLMAGLAAAAEAEAAAPAAERAPAAINADDACASCGIACTPDAVVCVACGFNRRSGKKLATQAPPPRMSPARPGNVDMGSAEAAVDSNASVGALRKAFFNDDEAACAFYVRRRSVMYSAERTPRECPMCDKPGEELHQLQWSGQSRANISLSPWTFVTIFLGRIMVQNNYKKYTFVTHHYFCRKCWKKVKKGGVGMGGCLQTGFLFMAALLGAPVALILIAKSGVSLTGNQVEWISVAVIMAVLIVGGLAFQKSLTPPALRFMTGKRFYMKKVVS